MDEDDPACRAVDAGMRVERRGVLSDRADAFQREPGEELESVLSMVLQPQNRFEFFAGLALEGVGTIREDTAAFDPHPGVDGTTSGVVLVHPDGSWARCRE